VFILPRAARRKIEDGIYHVMIRGVGDTPLFQDSDDKDKYLQLLKKFKDIYLFEIYSFCLMTTHGHMLIRSNGADISKFMKSINQCYAAYYNKRYERHGHVFGDRFKSKLVCDRKYLLTLSAYIHKNPKDIIKFKTKIAEYQYSSLGIYLGIHLDTYKLLNINYLLEHFSDNTNRALECYMEFINRLSDDEVNVNLQFKSEGSSCINHQSLIIRNFSPESIVKFVSQYTGSECCIHIKFNHRNSELRALCVVIMRSLCNFTLAEICGVIGNVTLSNVWRLSEKGLSLITTKEKYKNLISDLVNLHKSA
jgi:putative transposase